MSRRRLIGIVFTALIAVFVAGSIVTLTIIRNQLIDAIDRDLAVGLDLNVQVFDQFGSIEDFADLDVAASETATVIVTPSGDVDLTVLAGPAADPLPPPELPPSRIIDHVDEFFTTGGTDGGPEYRVAVGALEDGRFLALAQPLDELRSTLVALTRALLFTLLGVVAVLGVIFWLILRASLRPYDDMINTAQAIAAGDMDRRAEPSASNPEITRLTEALNIMLDRLQTSFDDKTAAEARLKQFAADASHELRTPLTTIRGYSEVYLSGAATGAEDIDKQMRRINSEAARMGRLVDELLTLARLDQGRGVEFQAVDVNDMARDAIDDALATSPDLMITSTIPPMPALVVGDRDALHQVVANLIANAALHAEGAAIGVGVDADATTVRLTVHDDGPGMPPEVADHAFDRFFRADTARRSATDSSGLGLAIVSAIVEAHGGTVALDTALGCGATFTIELPATPARR